jgi:hypothetical protein
MDKQKILQWVTKHMPVDVDGKTFFLHAAALIDPKDEYLWVFDKDPYKQEDITDIEPIVIKPVENKKVKLLI